MLYMCETHGFELFYILCKKSFGMDKILYYLSGFLIRKVIDRRKNKFS